VVLTEVGRLPSLAGPWLRAVCSRTFQDVFEDIVEPRWDVVFLRLDGLAPTCWQSLGGLKELMQCAHRLRTGPRHGGYKTKFASLSSQRFPCRARIQAGGFVLSNKHLKALYEVC